MVTILECKRCGYRWRTILPLANPKTCTRCKSYYWDVAGKKKKLKSKGGE